MPPIPFTINHSSSVSLNAQGGLFKNGVAYDIVKKHEVASTYARLQNEQHNGGTVSSRALAAAARVSPSYALKVINEVASGVLIDPASIVPNRPRGVGSILFNEIDEMTLLALRDENPSRSLNNYRRDLYQRTGTMASESTISDWFLNRFPIKGGLRVTSTVPIDKFKPDNVVRTFDYIQVMRQIDPMRVKFGDEKMLKGKELFNKKVRRCPITGVTPTIIVDSDFRNAYSIIGFCGIDRRTCPFDYYIGAWSNDADSFCEAVERSLAKGFLRPHDALVLDNAAIHRYREAESLEDWLWDTFHILLIFLPTRSPELNPIELSWQSLCQGLKNWDLSQPRPYNEAVVYAATCVMESFSHEGIAANYRHCGYDNAW